MNRRGRGAGPWSEGAGRDHDGTLPARVLGAGPPIVLLHGLVGSARYWGAAYDQLADRHQLVVPDLLGFGRSPKPNVPYRPDDHVDALLTTLDELEVRTPAVVVGHSAGSLIAIRLALRHPGRVRTVIGFGPPLYGDATAARLHLSAMGPMAKLFALPGPAAAVACHWVCNHRRLAARLAVATHPTLPVPIAADSVEHTWPSYTGTLTEVVLAAEAGSWLPGVEAAVTLVAGSNDAVVDPRHLGDLARLDHVDVHTWPGDHHLPVRQADRCVHLIGGAVS